MKHARSFVILLAILAALNSIQAGYDPTIGRWLSRDPMGEGFGTNLYQYVGNNPINAIDPFGLDYIFLNNSGAARLQGHAAALVGNNTTGWTYYSKDGITNGVQYDTLMVFRTFQDFINDPISGGYNRAVYFHTTLDQDFDMTIWGDAHLRDPYVFGGNNCGDFASGLAAAGGIAIPPNTGFGLGVTRPNTQYDDLIHLHLGLPIQLH